MTTTRTQLATEFRRIRRDKRRGLLHVYLAEPLSYELVQFLADLTQSDRDKWSTISRDHECGAEVLIYRPAWGADIQAMLEDVEPKAHIPTIRSRLKRHGGLTLKQLTPNAFVIHKDGELVTTEALTLEGLNAYSLYEGRLP